MDVSRELLFFFSALGAFNGLILGFYFIFFRKQKHISNFFLGMLLIMLSVRIGKSVFLYFNDSISYIFIQFGLGACTLIGPFLYFYLHSLIVQDSNIIKSWFYHVVAIIAIYTIVCVIYPYNNFYDSWQAFIIPTIYYEWLFYIILAGFLMKSTFKNIFSRATKISDFDYWILSVFIGCSIIWVAYKTYFYASYIVGALSFSFIFYLIVLLVIFNRKRASILFNRQPKYSDKKIDSTEAQALTQRLREIMEQKELFRDARLKLPEVAKKLDVQLYVLSQLLNDNLKKSFPVFVNEYRIKAAKEMILVNKNFTLEGIGKECGFNSNSTFYSTFKKITGTTPAQYKKQNMPAE